MKFRNNLSQAAIIFITLVLFILVMGVLFFGDADENIDIKPDIKVNKEVEIYKLRESATTLQKSIFDQLETVLKAETVDENEYAQLVARGFISEYFTLKNRYDEDDIGGLIYIPNELQDRFREYAKEIYQYFDYYIIEYGRDKLSEVTSIDISNIKLTNYDYIDQEKEINNKYDLDCYVININWEYNQDNEMDDSNLPDLAILKVVKWDEYYYVVEMEIK